MITSRGTTARETTDDTPPAKTTSSSSTVTIIISKYLSISSFCLSLITIIITITFLKLLHVKIKQNQSLRSPIYTGSSFSLDSFQFDSEGYLRPHTDELYEDVL